jgi:DNA-binding transcriptional MocR family regulator
MLPFRAGMPALNAVSFALWAQLVQRHTRTSLPVFAFYQLPTGYQPSPHTSASSGGRCTAEPIVIVSDQPKNREP